MTVTISVSQSEYEHFTRCKDAIEWIAENCAVEHWDCGRCYGSWDNGKKHSLLGWITEQQEPDYEPDYGAPTAGEVGDMAAKAYREGGR